MTQLSLVSKIQPPEEGLPYTTRPRIVAIVRNPIDNTILLIKDVFGIIFPGGGIEPNETYQQAFQREVQEESGYQNTTNIQDTEIILDFYRKYPEGNLLSKHFLFYGELATDYHIKGEFETLRIPREKVYDTVETDA